jgi:DNA-binding transcriptional LysR family regulator
MRNLRRKNARRKNQALGDGSGAQGPHSLEFEKVIPARLSSRPAFLRLFSARGAAIDPPLGRREQNMRDLNALTIFAKVVEERSFSGAALRLRMPISTVSRRVAELEEQLGVRLLERSTRSLRLTDVGTEVFEQALHSAELCGAVDSLISNSVSKVSGTLRLCSPPSISDSLIVPVVSAFQNSYPAVRVQVRITERIVDTIPEDIDIAFKVGGRLDPNLQVHKVLAYRHQVVASPAYLAGRQHPSSPRDLLNHRLFAFSFWRPDYTWTFVHADRQRRETIDFEPSIAMNDYAALAGALLAGDGIGELPPIVQPELLRKGLLVEVMPDWHLPLFDLALVHHPRGYIPRQIGLFTDFASQMVPKLFPALPV